MLAIFKKETSIQYKYQTMPLIHNSTVSDIPLHFQGNTIERVWMGEYKCQLSVKISAICQLSVKFRLFVSCQSNRY